MHLRKTLLPFFLLANVFCFSQNYIVNGSFEDFSSSTSGSQHLQDVWINGWTDPTIGTADIFYYPNGNLNGSSYPKPDSGFGNAAIFGSKNGEYWAEFMQGTLTHPLVSGITYRFSVAIYIDDDSGSPDDLNFIGVSFSDSSRANMALLAQGIYLKPDIKLTDQQCIRRKGRWDLYYQDYVAKGGEKYFIIGTFNPQRLAHVNSYDNSTYFLVDNFSLTGNDQEGLGPIPNWVFANDSVKPSFPLGGAVTSGRNNVVSAGSLVSEQIYFDYDKSDILPASYPVLNDIVDGMKAQPGVYVLVKGYSIDTKKRLAKKLSKARARAIADYLVAHGVDKSKVSYQGCGQYKKGSGDGKRVEFVFSNN